MPTNGDRDGRGFVVCRFKWIGGCGEGYRGGCKVGRRKKA